MKTPKGIGLTRRTLIQACAGILGRLSRGRLFGFVGLGGSAFAATGCAPDESDEPQNGSGVEPGPESNLHRAIRDHFPYLSFEDAVIDAFAADLVRHQGPWSAHASPRPFTRFLASTDFFQHGADESRPLTYVAYYDPYVSTCYNPFTESAGGKS